MTLAFGRSLQAQIDTLLLGPLSKVAASRQDLEHGSKSLLIFFIITGLMNAVKLKVTATSCPPFHPLFDAPQSLSSFL